MNSSALMNLNSLQEFVSLIKNVLTYLMYMQCFFDQLKSLFFMLNLGSLILRYNNGKPSPNLWTSLTNVHLVSQIFEFWPSSPTLPPYQHILLPFYMDWTLYCRHMPISPTTSSAVMIVNALLAHSPPSFCVLTTLRIIFFALNEYLCLC